MPLLTQQKIHVHLDFRKIFITLVIISITRNLFTCTIFRSHCECEQTLVKLYTVQLSYMKSANLNFEVIVNVNRLFKYNTRLKKNIVSLLSLVVENDG